MGSLSESAKWRRAQAVSKDAAADGPAHMTAAMARCCNEVEAVACA